MHDLDEEWFYKTFGIDAEIIIDHAWGIEPVTMKDIKSYHSENKSLTDGQVLPKPYQFDEERNVFLEMTDSLCCDMLSKNVISKRFSQYTGYDYKSLEHCPYYDGEISIDFYGRPHPKHSKGTVRLRNTTNLLKELQPFIMPSFDQKTDHRLLFRRLIICAEEVVCNNGIYQLDLFTNYEEQEREKQLPLAMQSVRKDTVQMPYSKGTICLKELPFLSETDRQAVTRHSEGWWYYERSHLRGSR